MSSVLAVAEMRKGKDGSGLDECLWGVVTLKSSGGRRSVRTKCAASLCTKYYCRIPNCSPQPIFDLPQAPNSELPLLTSLHVMTTLV